MQYCNPRTTQSTQESPIGTNPMTQQWAPGFNPMMQQWAPGFNPTMQQWAPGFNPTMQQWAPGFNPTMQQPSQGAVNPPVQPWFGAGQTVTTPFGAFHCPVCGYSGPAWHPGPSPSLGFAGPGYYPNVGGWGLGGLRRWGGTYTPQYAATGLPTDEEITEMVFDAIDADPIIPYDADIDVAVDAGVVTVTGAVPNKRVKHAAGDDAWWAPGVVDVKNDIEVTGRRRARTAPQEAETRTR